MCLLHATVVREMLTKFGVWATWEHVAPVFCMHAQTEASGALTAEANQSLKRCDTVKKMLLTDKVKLKKQKAPYELESTSASSNTCMIFYSKAVRFTVKLFLSRGAWKILLAEE